ncbi:hypothetical protein QOT17_004768 [Balamuthia mandrillaris]
MALTGLTGGRRLASRETPDGSERFEHVGSYFALDAPRPHSIYAPYRCSLFFHVCASSANYLFTSRDL